MLLKAVALYSELLSPQEYRNLLLQEVYSLRQPSLLRANPQHLAAALFSEAKGLKLLQVRRLKNHRLCLPEVLHKSQLVDRHSSEELLLANQNSHPQILLHLPVACSLVPNLLQEKLRSRLHQVEACLALQPQNQKVNQQALLVLKERI